MKPPLTLTLLGSLLAPAHAEFYNGNDLLRMMRGNNTEQAAAYGYVVGVNDALHKITLCIPNGVTVGQANDIVRAYLEANPQVRHFSGDSVVAAALMAVWPCKKGQAL